MGSRAQRSRGLKWDEVLEGYVSVQPLSDYGMERGKIGRRGMGSAWGTGHLRVDATAVLLYDHLLSLRARNGYILRTRIVEQRDFPWSALANLLYFYHFLWRFIS